MRATPFDEMTMTMNPAAWTPKDRVLLRDYPSRVQVCITCARVLVASPVARASDFQRNGHWADGRVGYRRECRECQRAPRDEASELARIDARLALEAAGVPLAEPMRRAHCYGSQRRLPAGPLVAWLEGLAAGEKTPPAVRSKNRPRQRPADLGWKKVALRLGCSPRTLWRITREDSVDELVVDRLATRHGGQTVATIYPDGAATEAPPLPGAAGFVEPECATPGCSGRRVRGARFCRACRARLRRVRREYEAEARFAPRGYKKAGERGNVPTCCDPGCDMPRRPGRRYCSDCEARLDAADGEFETAGEVA